eukprot:g1390.t1
MSGWRRLAALGVITISHHLHRSRLGVASAVFLRSRLRALMLVPNKNLDGRSHVAFQLNRLMALLVLMMLGWSHQWTRHPETNLQTGCLQYMTRLSVRREVGLFHRQVFSIMLLPLLFLQLYCINYFEAASLMFYPVIVFSGLFIGYVVCQEVPVIVTRRRTLTKVKNLLTYVLEQCDDTEMREVYLRANLASIFQAILKHPEACTRSKT